MLKIGDALKGRLYVEKPALISAQPFFPVGNILTAGQSYFGGSFVLVKTGSVLTASLRVVKRREVALWKAFTSI